eukprot:CAMPEP_0172512064 /NCGR_PEP_ID=MMETSP1066-20121228/241509_1 /TAXON_ID=671091 /ORGANISM="Coscinodiscus wailesii, Strain CCMP2513" /LENGTH=302 /DNA_ID=CAMNT_0013291701 /DNA_START=73 /DNA_END=981 /DNA_ORIENTATION=-
MTMAPAATRALRNTSSLLRTTAYRSISSSSAILSSISPPTSTKTAKPNIVVKQDKEKGIFGKLWEKYSISGQQSRIERGERLFRAAERRAMDRTWYTKGRLSPSFRSYHAVLTMHVWLLHKRLILDKISPDTSLMVQEELFDIFWNDTLIRIRAEGITEMLVNKHLKDVQQVTLQHCVHYDHAFTFSDPVRRREEVALAVWKHVLLENEEAYNDQINRLAIYVEWEYDNIVCQLPEEYWREGRIAWGDIVDFDEMGDNNANALPDVELGEGLPDGWVEALTESGKKYWWHSETMKSQWDKPE